MSIKYYYLSLRPRLRVLVPPSCVHRDKYSKYIILDPEYISIYNIKPNI